MKILVLDAEKCGLPFAMRCQAAGHDVRFWVSQEKGGDRCRIGDGIVQKVAHWEPSMKWADLVVMTDNTKYAAALRPYFREGYPILGTTEEAAELELDRVVGQKAMERAGIPVLPYEEFTSYEEAADFVRKTKKAWVSKPWGGAADKNLSYVPASPEDLLCRLARWKKEGLKGKFVLQEKVEGGMEMGVGAWFGPGGFGPIEENWEHKKLMVGDLGPTTGEMGTVMRYVKSSELFEKVLRPLETELHRRRFVGSVDINCMIDSRGRPWPLEFTCRMGWPAFNLNQALHEGDPAEWMVDLLEGRNTLEVCYDTPCVGVVMATGDFPWDRDPAGTNDGWPIAGINNRTRRHLYLTSVRMGEKMTLEGRGEPCVVTAGAYVLVATGTGDTVCEARESVYDTVSKISWSPHKTYRTDIGCRLEGMLPKLQGMGYARGMRYE